MIIPVVPFTRLVMFRIHSKYHFHNTGQRYYLNMKTMHMHKDSESRLLINCMTWIFSSLVASTRETQLELWGKPVLDVMLRLIIWAREGGKIIQTSCSCRMIWRFWWLMPIMASSPVGNKLSRKQRAGKKILYRKNDSAIIAYKEKRLKRRASVEDVIGNRLSFGGLLETVSNAVSITLYHRNCAAAFAVTPHRAITVDTGGAGDPKFRDLCTVCPELARKKG